ncbi:hypothetical protein [Nocardia sp. CA-290969]|uniref:hypothetical protein n=1 Tax=Nocardia sp. CA-290969 TaxID=3239986 RepID=UPI003D8B017C
MSSVALPAVADPEAVDASASADGTDSPDIQFTLSGGSEPEPAASEDPTERGWQLLETAAREMATRAPAGWTRMDAVFALTVAAETGVIYSSTPGHTVAAVPPPAVLESIRRHRTLSAELGDGPWWRLLLSVTADGGIEVEYDYGSEPFPDGQRFPPEAYRADLDAFPRAELPVWLAAYLKHDNRQLRSPARAVTEAAADRDAGVRSDPSGVDLPPLSLLTARWAILAAAFAAVGSPWGPRVLPALRRFEGAQRSGSSLYSLSGGRAVLSGGVWDAPELDETYNRGAALPRLYRGAPEWVAEPVLNDRAAHGTLTFCYWWDGGRWYRGESPPAHEVAVALPGVWDSGTVIAIIDELADGQDARSGAVVDLVTAAESGAVPRPALAAVFPAAGTAELDAAYYQLHLGGIAAAPPLPEQEALGRVAQELTSSGLDLSGYPVAELRADRLTTGWMVYVPVPPGELAVGRTIFYVADDGVVEWSSSAVAPSQYTIEFEQRFRARSRALL